MDCQNLNNNHNFTSTSVTEHKVGSLQSSRHGIKIANYAQKRQLNKNVISLQFLSS